MKTYDREKKKWVTVEESDRNKNKRNKDLCRGKKPHDFVLVLPHFVSYDENYKFNPEVYYEIMNETADFQNKQYERLEKLGIKTRFSIRGRKETQLYVCSVCKKQKYEYE